jgi:uracil-DNA glycosylase
MLGAMEQTYTTNEMLALLDWYREMGATHAVDDVATDWRGRSDIAPGRGFKYPERQMPDAGVSSAASILTPPMRDAPAEPVTPARVPSAPARPASPPAAAPPSRAFPTAPPDEAAHAAREQARTARSLADLRQQLERFDGCALKATAKNLCFFRGSEKARLMVIGEAPGRDEDIAGKPFVGAAGQLLDRMLAAIGESEASVHITNIVYWRPPGNRTPTPQEGQICRPFLERQIELVAPEIVLLLGGAAAKHMLDTPEGIMKLRGSWREIEVGEQRLRTMASLHPAYLLRTPTAKRQAWQDLLAVKLALGT